MHRTTFDHSDVVSIEVLLAVIVGALAMAASYENNLDLYVGLAVTVAAGGYAATRLFGVLRSVRGQTRAGIGEHGLIVWNDHRVFGCAWRDADFVGSPSSAVRGAADHDFRVRTTSGDSYHFRNDRWADFGALREQVRRAISTAARDRLTPVFEAGHDVAFGPLTVNHGGVRDAGRSLSFHEIRSVSQDKEEAEHLPQAGRCAAAAVRVVRYTECRDPVVASRPGLRSV